jgi:hypothetical protein
LEAEKNATCGRRYIGKDIFILVDHCLV